MSSNDHDQIFDVHCNEHVAREIHEKSGLGCASDRVKPSRDVSTAAKCSWKSREASLKPFKARLVLVETFKKLHVHRIALRHGRVHVRGRLVTKGPDSSLGEVHSGSCSEDIHMEEEKVEVKVQEEEVEERVRRGREQS